MRTILTASLVLSLAGCTPIGRPAPAAAETSSLMGLIGSEASMAAFEAAARKCGLTTTRQVADRQGGTFVALVGPTALIAEDDGRLACATKWLTDHPGELGFVGNEVR